MHAKVSLLHVGVINDPLYPVPTDLLFDSPLASVVGLNESWLPYIIGVFESGIIDFNDPFDQFETFLQWLLSGELMMLPVGTILPYGGDAIPVKYLECVGQLLSRSTYAKLFEAIGSIYGVGDGITNFKLPDLRGRSPMARGNNGSGINRARGQLIGTDNHALTIAEMPAHAHTVPLQLSPNSGTQAARGGGGASGTVSSSSQGSGTAHNIVHPVSVITFMIYTGV